MAKYTPVFTITCAPSFVEFQVFMNKYGDLTEKFGHHIECDTPQEAYRIITEVISIEGQAKHLGSNLFLELVNWGVTCLREDE